MCCMGQICGNRRYPAATRSEVMADYNMCHYESAVIKQAEVVRTMMNLHGTEIPMGVLCDLIYRYAPIDEENSFELR